MLSIEQYISKHKWNRAEQELIRSLGNGNIAVEDYNTWGKYAGEIERGMGTNWAARENLWRDLRRVVEEAEVRKGTRTHKGLIYFKLGGMSLLTGRAFATAIRWFERAYKEDQRLFEINHEQRLVPHHQSGYRILLIMRAFERFRKSIRNPQIRQLIAQLIHDHPDTIGRYFVALFDRTLVHIRPFPRLSVKAFDDLLGRNIYRVSVEENYRGAEWICNRAEELKRTNIEQYGLAKASIVLCGTTIEGILLNKPTVRRRIHSRWYTLDSLTISYLLRSRPRRELAAGLFFTWFARNLIHPAVAKKTKHVLVDINFADFVLTLTGSVIAMLAKRHQPR
jgi:hypothetical protein